MRENKQETMWEKCSSHEKQQKSDSRQSRTRTYQAIAMAIMPRHTII
jgi:hypothetical protein